MNIVTKTTPSGKCRKAPHHQSGRNRGKRQPQREWLIDHVLPRVGVALVVGPAASDAQVKVALHLEVCVLDGMPFGETPAERGIVVARERGQYSSLFGSGASTPCAAMITFLEQDISEALEAENVSTASELAAKHRCCVLIGSDEECVGEGVGEPDVVIHVKPTRGIFAGRIEADGRVWLFTIEHESVAKVWEYKSTGETA